MIEVVQDPTFRRTDFDADGKKPGITAIVRLKNEEEFAAVALRSILPYFDEIVIVFNSSVDRTQDIVARFEHEDPNRVKALHYVPEVFPQGSVEHRSLPPDSVHSLVHYNNYALSKASFRIRCKWDGDMVAVPDAMERVVGRLRRLTPARIAWWSSPWKWGYWWGTGVNLWDHQGRIFVPRLRPVAGKYHDLGFWPAGRRNAYKHHGDDEYLFTRFLVHTYVGYLFFHLKGMKNDRGVGVYQFDRNPDSLYRERIRSSWTDPDLLTFEEFRAREPMARDLPSPESTGIRPIATR